MNKTKYKREVTLVTEGQRATNQYVESDKETAVCTHKFRNRCNR